MRGGTSPDSGSILRHCNGPIIALPELPSDRALLNSCSGGPTGNTSPHNQSVSFWRHQTFAVARATAAVGRLQQLPGSNPGSATQPDTHIQQQAVPLCGVLDRSRPSVGTPGRSLWGPTSSHQPTSGFISAPNLHPCVSS